MKTSYKPSKLPAIAAQVRKEHPTSSEIRNYQLDNGFLDEVRQWAKLPKEDVDGEAITIPIRKVRLLANYVPANSLHLPLLNLTRILFLRANEEIARSLFILWQDFFENQDLCYLLYRIVQDKAELVKKIVSNTKLENTTMLQWFPSKNIPYAVGRECMRWQKSDRIRFSDRLMTLGIMPSTRLGQRCIQEYLTFCDRTGYLEISDRDMLPTLKKYSPDSIKLFLKNILTELKVEDFQRYYQCGSYLRNTYTSDAGTLKYKNFFSGFTPEQELKYHRWLNYILVKDTFVDSDDDARLKFWSQYVPYSLDVYKVSISASLVIEFEAYCVIEFFETIQGALYIYPKDTFEREIKFYVVRRNNTELRHELYTNLRRYCTERIVHREGWQHKTSRYLMAHSIV